MKMDEKYNGEPITLLFASAEHGTYAVVIEEGTGDNLWDEDIEEGYVDYVNWAEYTMKIDYNLPMFVEWDGGMILTKKYVQDMTVKEICDMVCRDAGFAIDTPFMVYSSEELSI